MKTEKKKENLEQQLKLKNLLINVFQLKTDFDNL